MRQKNVTGMAKLNILFASKPIFDAGIKNRINQGIPAIASERAISDFQDLPIGVVPKFHITCGRDRISNGPQSTIPCILEVWYTVLDNPLTDD